MNTASLILSAFWFSFFFMYFLTTIAPEYIEDDNGFLVPRKRYIT